jgi:hypothetical protein
MDKVKAMFKTRAMLVALVVIFCAVSVSGCASFRKKFVRQKKNKDQTEEFVPVLSPVEYPRPDTSPTTVYRDHYAMTKAFFRDLEEIIGSKDSSDKQQLYVLAQVSGRMELMAGVLADGEKKTALDKLVLQIKEVAGRYDQPEGIRRYDLIKSTVRHIENDFLKSFKPAVVQEDLKKTP